MWVDVKRGVMPEKPFEPSGLGVLKPRNAGGSGAFIVLVAKKGPSYEETTEDP